VGKKENVCARNGDAGKRGATTVAGAAWPESRQFDGSTTLVEEEEGLAWWWRVAETVIERDIVQSERRLAGVVWPEARRNSGSTTTCPIITRSPTCPIVYTHFS